MPRIGHDVDHQSRDTNAGQAHAQPFKGLDGRDAPEIAVPGREAGPDRHEGESGRQERHVAKTLRQAGNRQCGGHHAKLSRHRHGAGREARIPALLGERLRQEGQHGAVRGLEREGGTAENEQRMARHQGLPSRLRSRISATGGLVVDRAGIDAQHHGRTGSRHDRDGQGHPAEPQPVAECRRQGRIHGIAGMVERFVPGDAPAIDLLPDDPQRKGRHQRGETGIGHADDDLAECRETQRRGRDDKGGTDRDARHRGNDRGALGRDTIDERAERRRSGDARQPGDAHRDAGAGRVETPLLEENAQERAEPFPRARQREVERV